MREQELNSRTDIIDRAIDALMEHFEAVQILATTRDGHTGDTYDWMRGRGNWYARTGLAHSFIKKDEAQDIGLEVANQLPHDDDGDDWKGNG